MKKLLAVAALAAAGLPALATLAADSATLNVQANVVGNCKFNTASATMNFAALDQTLTTDANANATLSFWCTRNATYTLSDNGGANVSGVQRRLNDGGTNYINYSIAPYVTTGAGQGKTTPITVNLSGTIANADYVDAPAGSYSDQVTFTITP